MSGFAKLPDKRLTFRARNPTFPNLRVRAQNPHNTQNPGMYLFRHVYGAGSIPDLDPMSGNDLRSRLVPGPKYTVPVIG